ncbi:MAG: carboxypeptidase-like regulatory domain-containing protein, partial [Bacteroidaceae bacterium]|nr:carboxypeptidase-like regulatory domain-containing protein [Bacteroidaceae bacterium]
MSKIYTCLLLAMFLATSMPAMSQRVTIRGKVTDDKQQPIEIANIKVEGQAAGTITDLQGRYIFTCESSDSLVVAYSMIGYQTRKKTFRNPVDTITVDVVLPAMDYTLEGVEVVDKQRQMG